MTKPPRDAKKNLFYGGVGLKILIIALIQAGLVIAGFIAGKHFGGDSLANTMAFVMLNLVETLYILSAKSSGSMFRGSHFKNKWLFISLFVSLSLLLVFTLTPARVVLGVVSMPLKCWFIALGLSFAIIPINEIYKLIARAIKKKKEKTL